jgi:hypothetical protein
MTFTVNSASQSLVVQKTSCKNSGTTTTCTLPAGTTAGNLLLLTSENDGAGPTIAGVTGGGGGAWQRLGATTFNYSTKNLELWAAPNLAGGSATVTVTYSGSVDSAVGLLELAGLKTANVVDAACSDTNRSPDGSAQTTLTASGACTPAQNNTVIVLAGGAIGGNTYTGGSGFTLQVQTALAFASTALELAVQTTAAPITGTMTISPADQWGTIRRALVCNGACPQ